MRRELLTTSGTPCFVCAPPTVYCATAQDACTPGPCECSDPAHAKLPVAAGGAGTGDEAASGLPCFRCAPAPGTHGPESSSLATFLLFVVVGLGGGCVLRRLRGDPDPPGSARAKARRPAESRRTWSERLAEELEDRRLIDPLPCQVD